jgi:hypothetical protein
MLSHLDEQLGHHLDEVDGRIDELMTLRREIQRYRDHVIARQQAADTDGERRDDA